MSNEQIALDIGDLLQARRVFTSADAYALILEHANASGTQIDTARADDIYNLIWERFKDWTATRLSNEGEHASGCGCADCGERRGAIFTAAQA